MIEILHHASHQRGARSLISSAWVNIRAQYKTLLIAQLLSFLLAASGAANSSLHFECQLSAPTFQAFLIYFGLSFHLFAIPHYSEIEYRSPEEEQHSNQLENESQENNLETTTFQKEPEIILFRKIPIYASIKMYILMAVLDVEANYLIYLAFRYTTLTSVSLLDALAIPSAMICSKLILSRRYSCIHFIGALLCILGIFTNILGDYHEEEGNSEQVDDDGIENDKYPYKVSGDILAIFGALTYGLNDVLTERIVKKHNVNEYLGMIGLFGSIVCLIQMWILEGEAIHEFFARDRNQCSASKGLSLLFACTLFSIVSYAGMSRFLISSEAALLNLSLLTGDLWAALFIVVEQNIVPTFHFWISLILIVIGVFVFEMTASPSL